MVPIQMLMIILPVRELTFSGFPVYLCLFLRMELWVSPALGWGGDSELGIWRPLPRAPL